MSTTPPADTTSSCTSSYSSSSSSPRAPGRLRLLIFVCVVAGIFLLLVITQHGARDDLLGARTHSRHSLLWNTSTAPAAATASAGRGDKVTNKDELHADDSEDTNKRQATSKQRAQTGQKSGSRAPSTYREFYRRRSQPVNTYTHRILLAPQSLCLNDTLLVILVHTRPSAVDQRTAIRQTWGSVAVIRGSVKTWPSRPDCCPHTRLAFVVGLSRDDAAVRSEHATTGDIIQGDFIDSYHNMTLKSLLGLKIVSERCPHVTYLLKSDDDMIVNLPFLMRRLSSLKTRHRTIVGPIQRSARVFRHGKWAISPEQFPFSHYPMFASGSAYVFTRDLVDELYNASHFVPHIFIDDVYVTGILARIIGHVTHVGSRQMGRRRHSREFAFAHSPPPSACDIERGKVISGTDMTVDRLTAIWRRIASGHQCKR